MLRGLPTSGASQSAYVYGIFTIAPPARTLPVIGVILLLMHVPMA